MEFIREYYLLLTLIVLWAIYYFSDKEHFSETGSMLILLLLAFYLDIGLLSSILSDIPYFANIIAGMEHFILLTPWLGLVLVFFILPSTSGYVNGLKIAFMVWYCVTLLGALLTGAGLLGEFGQNFQESVEANLENKADQTEVLAQCPSDGIYTLQCLKEQLSSPGDGTIDSCVLKKKEECIDTHACEQEGKGVGQALTECLNEKRTARSEQKGVQSKTDMNADRFVYATVSIDTDYTKKTYLESENDVNLLSVPFNVNISNPIAVPLTVDMSCMFEKGTGDSKEQVKGYVFYGVEKLEVYTLNTDRSEEMTRTCVPERLLEGSWNLIVNLDVKDIVSYSYLNRLLVHEWDSKDETLQDAISGLDSTSLGAKELARLNFAIGDPMDQKFIESEDFLTFQASIENVARGKITYVTEYRVDSSDVIEYFQDGCVDKYDMVIPTMANKLYTLSHCTAQVSAPFKSRLELSSSVEPYIIYTFEGMLKYNYQLQDKKKIDYSAVKVLS